MVQSKWSSKNICQFPAMNEALEIQGQVRITPNIQVRNKKKNILIQVERNRIV